MRKRRRSRYDMRAMFLFTGSPGSIRSWTPSRPAANCTPSARYGFADGSGIRFSQRVASARWAGTRMRGDTFCVDQETFTGASYPGTRRLYEFTSGFVTAQ